MAMAYPGSGSFSRHARGIATRDIQNWRNCACSRITCSKRGILLMPAGQRFATGLRREAMAVFRFSPALRPRATQKPANGASRIAEPERFHCGKQAKGGKSRTTTSSAASRSGECSPNRTSWPASCRSSAQTRRRPDEAGRARGEADFLTSRALRLAPDNDEVKKLRDEVVKLLELKTN